MVDTLIHKWLGVPHRLHVGVDKGDRKADQTIVLIHGLGSSHKMWRQVIRRIKLSNTRVISVDLLGFGDSPKPIWQTYNAKVHARALRVTLRKYKVRGDVIIIGHSLGGLVAVQYASLYPRQVKQLILCSPPFYRPPLEPKGKVVIPQIDDLYRRFYRYARSKSELASKIAQIVRQARLVDPNFTVSDETLPAIASSLEMSIENQTTLSDIKKLKMPIDIIYGQLDVLLVKRNIRALAKTHDNINIHPILAGHDINIVGNSLYLDKIISLLDRTDGTITS